MKRLGALIALLLAIAAPALGHVEVSPDSAPKGDGATFTFDVEDERDNANEVGVEIVLPPDVPPRDVDPAAPLGWTTDLNEASTSVKFTHAKPGSDGDQTFTLTVDPLPNAGELVFKTLVTYDNGDIDRWIDVPTGGEEPPHPAAVVKLTGGAATPKTSPGRNTLTTLTHPDKTNKTGIAAVIVVAVVVVGGLIVFATRGRRRGA
jgi:uncharacterized protein YcnI